MTLLKKITEGLVWSLDLDGSVKVHSYRGKLLSVFNRLTVKMLADTGHPVMNELLNSPQAARIGQKDIDQLVKARVILRKAG